MDRGHSSCNGLRGRRLVSATLALVLTVGLAAGATAQKIGTTPGLGAPPGGIGGGAGVIAPHPLPPMAPAITTPVIPPVMSPSVTVPQAAPPVVAPAPAPIAPAAVVRFRCEVIPQDQSCRDPGVTDGGGGDDAECRCGRDYCYYTETGSHICEKQ